MKKLLMVACAAALYAAPALAQDATTTSSTTTTTTSNGADVDATAADGSTATTTTAHATHTIVTNGVVAAPSMDPSPLPEHDAHYGKGGSDSHNPDLAPGSDVKLGSGTTGQSNAKSENDTTTPAQ